MKLFKKKSKTKPVVKSVSSKKENFITANRYAMPLVIISVIVVAVIAVLFFTGYLEMPATNVSGVTKVNSQQEASSAVSSIGTSIGGISGTLDEIDDILE
ncbi:MAG: hypothetical protein ABH821_03170 [archaeon]